MFSLWFSEIFCGQCPGLGRYGVLIVIGMTKLEERLDTTMAWIGLNERCCSSVRSWKISVSWTIRTLSTRQIMAIILVSMEWPRAKLCHTNSTSAFRSLSEDQRFLLVLGMFLIEALLASLAGLQLMCCIMISYDSFCCFMCWKYFSAYIHESSFYLCNFFSK